MINFIKKQLYLNESWIKSKTLINLRWLAIVGQGIAIAVSDLILKINFNLEACVLIFLFTCIVNLATSIYLKGENRLSAFKTFLFLAFDLAQISVLLFFSGGISNPFSMLIIVPVVVSASSLPLVFSGVLGVMTVLNILFLSFKYTPLTNNAGVLLAAPEILLIAFSVSLIITVTFLASYARRVSLDNSNMNKAFQATQVALEREKKFTALTGIVAALGHELGSPLATIKLASTELLDEIDSRSPIYKDIQLISDQIERCKSIIADMGMFGKDDQYVKIVDFFTLILEAIEPYENYEKKIIFRLNGIRQGDKGISIREEMIPFVRREPELIHGIRNIIHNAMKFSSSSVDINLLTTRDKIYLEIIDDGKGFPHDITKMIGEPFLRKNNSYSVDDNTDTAYSGMGLGLFIANVLIERKNGKLKFSNVIDKGNTGKKIMSGAKVEISWERTAIEVSQSDKQATVKENPRNVK